MSTENRITWDRSPRNCREDINIVIEIDKEHSSTDNLRDLVLATGEKFESQRIFGFDRLLLEKSSTDSRYHRGHPCCLRSSITCYGSQPTVLRGLEGMLDASQRDWIMWVDVTGGA